MTTGFPLQPDLADANSMHASSQQCACQQYTCKQHACFFTQSSIPRMPTHKAPKPTLSAVLVGSLWGEASCPPEAAVIVLLP